MTIKEIDQALEEGQSLKQIAQAFSEIANLKIKKIRSAVERNRLFFTELSDVFSLVKRLAFKKRITTLKPKKTISLLLTSNYRFYGNINSDLIDFFVQTTSQLDTDRIILGKAAIDFFKATKVFSNYKEILLKTDQPGLEELTTLVNIIKEYNQVLVFYCSLKSLLVQQPTVLDITAFPPTQANPKEPSFIFEPELPKILAFFDSQIITLLLESTFLESELARTASRFISMDTAETEANKFTREYEKLKAYAQRNLENNTILENFASLIAVRKESING